MNIPQENGIRAIATGSGKPERRRSARGFTLIELVVVIVILGILGAFALPRFNSLGARARIATLQTLAGSLRSAATLAHALQLTQGLGINASVSMENATVTMINRYPRAHSGGIGNTFVRLRFTQSGGGTGANSIINYTLTGYTPPSGQCRVRYQAANPSASRPMPVVTVQTTGC